MSKRQKSDKQLFSGLAKDFHELVSNKQLLRTSVEHFLNNVIDEISLGIIFDQHRKYKTNAYDLEIDENCDEGYGNLDLANQHKLKKTLNCTCPACKREYAASRFANHLRSCMGMGRKGRSCNATKRVTGSSKDRENSSYEAAVSDNDDDPDWSSGDQRKKKKDKNRSRNNRGNNGEDGPVYNSFSDYHPLLLSK